ncbi:MAG: rhodanese-like domain-containing protein [Proteobacteria bacterium]|nr:rhodanese-like domain-containing protein [Pseudomonadota bacterium]HQR04217.1 rhodanese-like domain-containing protein [Rhodocyclaceae bacterium]
MQTPLVLEFIKENLPLVAIAVASGAVVLWQTLRGNGRHQLSAAEATLKINREDAVVVDVRESSEWSSGHIPNARHIPLGQLEKRIAELEKFKSRPLIVCCASGNRAADATATLRRIGFEQAYTLRGGIGGWVDAGLPTTGK